LGIELKTFLFPTFFEAKPFLDNYNFLKKDKNIFVFESFYVIIIGIGYKNVLKSLKNFLQYFTDEVLIVGVCFSPSYHRIGDIVEPKTVISENMLNNFNINNIDLPLLITVRDPVLNVFDFERRFSYLKAIRDSVVVDMETYWIIDFLLKNKVGGSVKIFRIVSDNGEEDFKLNFKERKVVIQKSILNVAKIVLSS